MLIKGINALVDAKRVSSFNNAIKMLNANVEITHNRLVTLENRTSVIRQYIRYESALDDITQSLFLVGYGLLFVVICCCLYFSCFGCDGDGAIMLGNVVRVYPGTVQGLTFYLSEIYITKILACLTSAKSLLWSPRLVTSMK